MTSGTDELKRQTREKIRKKDQNGCVTTGVEQREGPSLNQRQGVSRF